MKWATLSQSVSRELLADWERAGGGALHVSARRKAAVEKPYRQSALGARSVGAAGLVPPTSDLIGRRRLLQVVDHQHFDRHLLLFELQAELRLHRFYERRLK